MPDFTSYDTMGQRNEVIAELQKDDDWWVARCAGYPENAAGGHETMQVIERGFLLQRVDMKNSRLLRLTKRDLHDDLLHDYPDLAVSLLHGMATRLRGMVS